jgi:hypothetical protein
MITIKHSFYFFLAITIAYSCHKDKVDNSIWEYSGTGDGNIDTTKKATINYKIASNLNVTGFAILKENSSVNHDLNLNQSGKVVILTSKTTDTVYIDGNSNIDDTLLIQRGVLKVGHDLNINAKGVVNCSNDAKVIVIGSLNQSGTLRGFSHFTIYKSTNINNKQTTYDLPIPYYSSSKKY